MGAKPEHILNLLYTKVFESEQKLARYKDEGWTECVEEEQGRLDDWKLLYDAVDAGLLDDLRAASEAWKSRTVVTA